MASVEQTAVKSTAEKTNVSAESAVPIGTYISLR